MSARRRYSGRSGRSGGGFGVVQLVVLVVVALVAWHTRGGHVPGLHAMQGALFR